MPFNLSMKKFFTSILILTSICIFAQDASKKDSLYRLLQNTESKIHHAEGLHKLAMLIGSDSVKRAIDFELKALQNIDDSIVNQKLVIDIQNNLGFLYYMDNNFQQSINSFKAALDLLRLRNDKTKIVKILNNLGVIHQILGLYDVALDYLFESLEIKKQLFDTLGIARTLNNIGVIYKNINRYNESYKFTDEALHIYLAIGSDKDLADVYNNLGTIYEARNENDTALYYYYKSLKTKSKIHDIAGQANTYNNIGSVYLGKNQYDSAYINFQKSYYLRKKINDRFGLASSYDNLARYFLENEVYDSALIYVNQSLDIAIQENLLEQLQRNYAILSRIYDSLGKTDLALQNYKLFTLYKDSVIRQENQDKLSNLAIQFETEQLARDKKMLKKQYEIQRNKNRTVMFLLILLIIVFIFSVIILNSRFKLKKKANKALSAKNVLISKKQGELEETLEELYESEEKYRTVVNKLQEGIFMIQDKRMIYVNKAFTDIFGYKIEELLSMEMTNLIAPEYRRTVSENYDKRMKGEEIPAQYEIEILTKNKERRYVILNTGVAHYRGKPTSVGSVLDISSIKKIENDLRKAKEDAEKATQMKSMFLASLSHEIRTPLSSIIGIAGVLEETKLTEEQKEYLNVINISGNNLMSLINNILDFSKIESGKLELGKIEFSIHEVVEEVCSVLNLQAEESEVDLSSDIAEKVPKRVVGDPMRLKQILINLVNNAIKFTKQGSVNIKVQKFDEDENTYRVKFNVIDTGIGVAVEQRNKLFNAFSQADVSIARNYGGTGLGLAISKHFVMMMNGEIGVESKSGKGSNFWFTIVFDKPEKQKQETSEEKQNLIKGKDDKSMGKMNVLLVEDNLLNQKFAEAILTKQEHKVDIAENGKIGVELFENNKYDLVLMDIQMPVMDGIEATKRIRSIEKKNKTGPVKILAVTAYAMEGDEEKFYEAGIDDILRKPYKAHQLIERIRN